MLPDNKDQGACPASPVTALAPPSGVKPQERLEQSRSSTGAELARFDHHPDPAIDFCIEVEELENIANDERLGLTGFGREADQRTLDGRVERAMEFRVGADSNCVAAKAALRTLAKARGFIVDDEVAYMGQPMRRRAGATGEE